MIEGGDSLQALILVLAALSMDITGWNTREKVLSWGGTDDGSACRFTAHSTPKPNRSRADSRSEGAHDDAPVVELAYDRIRRSLVGARTPI